MTLDLLSKLERLTRLKEQDILTEAEFDSHKEALCASIVVPIVRAADISKQQISTGKISLYIIIGLALLGVLISIDEEQPPAHVLPTGSALYNTPHGSQSPPQPPVLTRSAAHR